MKALAGLAGEPDVQRVLAGVARMDPSPSVRAAGVRSLAHAGAVAFDALRERLGDPSSSVRLAAVGALLSADSERAPLVLEPLLRIAPTPAGIEAARLLARRSGDDGVASRAAARSFLRQALSAASPSLRSQAGVALASLPAGTEAPLEAVREALASEPVATVRLSLARALWRADRPAARMALEGLLRSGGMPAVQAAALLSSEGHAEATRILQHVLSSEIASILRRTAARAIARDALQPDRVRSALRDDDAFVRIYAAGGILAAAAAAG